MSTLLLTPEQSAILQAREPAILISAVAGSGKSTTLAHAVALRRRSGTPADCILALVFSEAARHVFLNYLAQTGYGRDTIAVYTYDEFARNLFNEWTQRGYIDGAHTRHLQSFDSLRPRIYQAIEDAAALAAHDGYYEFTLNDAHAEYILDTLAWLKGTLRLRRLSELSIRDFASQEDLPEGLVSILREYERARNQDIGLYEFQSPQDYVYDCLSTLAECDYIELPDFDLIVADEWHDINAAHLQLLQRLHARGGQLMAAGDADQVIHMRHGAHPDFMGPAFFAAFETTRRSPMPLSRSFRCGPTLALAAGNLAGKTFESWRTEDTGISVLLQAQLYHDQPNGLARHLQSLQHAHQDLQPHHCAILLRSADLSIDIENELIRQDMPYRIEGCKSYFERDEILILRGVLGLLCGTLAGVQTPDEALPIMQALGQYCDSPALSPAQWRAGAQDVARNPESIQYFYSGQLHRLPDPKDPAPHRYSIWQPRLVHAIESLRPRLSQQVTAGTLLREANEILHLQAYTRQLYLRQEDTDTVERSILSFIRQAEQSGLDALAFQRMLFDAQRKGHTLRHGNARQAQQVGKVHLCTIAAAKGQEWRIVMIPGLSRHSFPKPQVADPAEELRLLYVAMTRAQQHLVLVSDDLQHPWLVRMKLRHIAPTAQAMLLENRQRHAIRRIYLQVPYADRIEARNKGAQWDPLRKQWWIPDTLHLPSFKQWLPEQDHA